MKKEKEKIILKDFFLYFISYKNFISLFSKVKKKVFRFIPQVVEQLLSRTFNP
jgi:hypothetical protein